MRASLDVIRTVRFTPYRKGAGPTFTLTLWDTHRRDHRGQTVLGYCLYQSGRVLFRGEDFAGSPLHADDSDATIASLMTFLTLRPGDIDAEHFVPYTESQYTFATSHAEALAIEVADRFGGGGL